mmetsp:Transcript_32559/g.33208  ORF Transcript_32559/g.33208 Transcript_32559/m.33208 type:complete len:90 (-) Transcript_32559:2438-2707(-)
MIGESHSLVAVDTGDIYAFGRGREGQLGTQSCRDSKSVPQLITALQNEYVLDVACGAMTSYAITASGSVYQWYFTMSYNCCNLLFISII